ncbi:MAG: hypothetical protein ASARMPRED_004620 [Alectoria sarmentosa]|nr:MAG: hypothetical protein ASARMPRED_004620 [Alectoria sarmentosa]
MADISHPPKSPTLLPPRKSVELEDPGAHDLETSEAEEDVFSDAQEARNSHSGSSSPVPTTRVEKADRRNSYGRVPDTAAYKKSEQDAMPDDPKIIPDGRESRPHSSTGHQDHVAGPRDIPIPKMVVEKVDPKSPSHGDVPGTAAHSKRQADAVPDVVLQAPERDEASISGDRVYGISTDIQIPTTMITKVDSKPSHGEVPGTDAFDMRKGDAKPDVVEKKGDASDRSKLSKPKRTNLPIEGASPIAADGGFGPMDYEESEDESVESKHDEADNDTEADAGEGFGDDFDDFEAGAENDDFGDFDEGFEQFSMSDKEPAETDLPAPSVQPLPPSTSPFVNSLDDILDATKLYLDEIFPLTKETYPPAPPTISDQNSIFLTDRSLSLWSQLVAPPPLQPPNWVRSRIRRLFLVSLGVPVDLDEILPASKQKKLILPSIHLRNRSQSPPDGRQTESRVRLKQDNGSSASVDQPSTNRSGRRRKGPPSPPELALQTTKTLCATTHAALSNMTDDELQAHVRKLEELTTKASEVLEYWLKRRDSAVGDKEAFEGVIENLVKHARRVRK